MPERLLVVPVALALASGLLAMASAESTSDWVVGWVGSPRAKDAASVFAKYAGMVLDAPVAVADKRTAKAKHAFLVTDAKNGPKDVAAKLEGKRLDAFTIQYPVKLDGQDVCSLLAHDEQGYDYPVYHFLTKFMGVHWVGPGDLGVVWTRQPNWAMPAKIDLVMNPDFEMRLWSGDSFSSREWLARSGRMGFHHALGHVFHPDKHGGTPEVYPLVGGKRYVPAVKTGPRALSGWQPCTASPKSAEIATQHVLETLTKSPQMLSVSLSVNDGAGNTCECELCRAQDAKDAFQPGKRPNLSDRFYRFYNAVMGRVLEKAPNAYIAVLGYGPCKVPPTEVKVHSRIQVFEVQPSAEALKAWKAAGATPNMYLWLWDGGFLTVRPDLHTLADVIRTSRDLGGLGLYSEIKAHWVISAPKFYVLAHLLWDTRQDPDKLLNDYLRLAYGESAAPHVRAFFDKWYEIYRRRPKEELFKTSWGWRDPVQLQDIRRDDLAAMDAALRNAEKASLTPEQKQRLAYLATYYQLMRINAEQYLVGREMGDRAWVSAQPPEAVLKAAEGSLTLTADFDRVWSEQVATDKTGWLMDGRAQKNPDAYWDDFLAQLRTMVSSAHETAVDAAFDVLTERSPKAAALAYWQDQMKAHPRLEAHIGPQMNKLKGIVPPDVVTNGSFEKGAPGDPPALDGWDFYEFYGMVKGVKAKHAWQKRGHDGGHAIGLGEGQFPEMKAIVSMEKGRRYELSLWYKTEGRETPASFWIYGYDGPLASPREIDQEKISRFVRIDLEPTDGQWRKVTRSLTPARGGTFVLQLAAYYQAAGVWTWFDDIEIRKIW